MVAGNASPRGIHDLLLADPELINSTKAAWLGSSPDCRWEQERCGSRQCGRYQQEAQGKEAAGRCRGECGDREVTVMEPEFKKQNLRGFSEKLNPLVNLQEYLIDYMDYEASSSLFIKTKTGFFCKSVHDALGWHFLLSKYNNALIIHLIRQRKAVKPER